MDWILQNLENVLVPIIIMILYGLGSRAQKKQQGEVDELEPVEEIETSADEARRVREIQEEIRRKIAERTGRPQPPATPRQAATLQPAEPRRQYSRPATIPAQMPGKSMPPPASRPPAIPLFDQTSHQREIEAKMRKVRELEAKIKSKPQEAAIWGERRKSTPKGQLRKELFKDLSNPLGQKKAILVGEILGVPVGIKGPAGWKANV